jgi:hypothetical protein
VTFDEFIDVIAKSNVTVCFWFGRPPCMRCGSDHGDEDASDELDALWRESASQKISMLRADLAGSISRLAQLRSVGAVM